MPVMIRLARQGAKKKPEYLIIAVDKDKKRDGSYLQKLGHYRPRASKPQERLEVDLPAIQAWTAKGAQFTQTVGQLVKSLAK